MRPQQWSTDWQSIHTHRVSRTQQPLKNAVALVNSHNSLRWALLPHFIGQEMKSEAGSLLPKSPDHLPETTSFRMFFSHCHCLHNS